MTRIPVLEKKVLLSAVLLSAGHLALIAFAAYQLGISVVDCETDDFDIGKPTFEKLGDDLYQTHVVAKMWAYEPNVIRLPTGATLEIFLSAKDVVHGFHIERTNVNLMAIPGTLAKARVIFREPGRYNIVCHEYCGSGHQNMYGVIFVQGGIEGEAAGLSQDALLAEAAPGLDDELDALAPPRSQADDRLALARNKGCLACHSLDGSLGVGPSFKRLFGKSEPLAEGGEVVVDDDYLRESILAPAKRVVKGFGAVMPPLPLTDLEVEELIKFIKSIE